MTKRAMMLPETKVHGAVPIRCFITRAEKEVARFGKLFCYKLAFASVQSGRPSQLV